MFYLMCYVFIVFVLHDSIVLFYLLCIFNVNRAPWKSSIAILKGLPCIKKTEINK